MDRERIAGLTAELTAQMRVIERVYQRLQARVAAGLDTPGQLDSVAYQLHNYYCAVEDLLKMVAIAFENQIGMGGEWHRTLLLRMSQPVLGIRPAFLTEPTLDGLNRLRGFRHFVRHAYGAEIDRAQLQANLAVSNQIQPLLVTDFQAFLAALADMDNG